MLKLIGFVTVIYFMFYFGLVQLAALYTMVFLSFIAGV